MSRLRQWLNQMQLSLFGAHDVVAPDRKPSNPIPKTKSPRTKKEPQPVSLNPSPVRERAVMLGQHMIPYRLERARRRTVGMIVDHVGLRVRANNAVSIAEIEQILQSRGVWILNSLEKLKNTTPRSGFMPNLAVEDGELLPILGRQVRVFWRKGAAAFDAIEWLQAFQAQDAELSLVLRDVLPERREAAIRKVLTTLLLEYLYQRAEIFAKKHDLKYRVLALSSAKTTWGTCRTDGTIRINWRLVFLEVNLVDYVLAHELAHTVFMNHSKFFWWKVSELCPDYKIHVKALKSYNLRAT